MVSWLSMVQNDRRSSVVMVVVSIVLGILIVSADSWTRYRRILASMDGSMGTPFPSIDPASPTGYEGGMRRVILPQVGVDGCHWIMHTQKLLKDGGWRIRFTDIDNCPDGREIHWSHGFIWWLIFLGKLHSMATGLPLPASVEAVSPYANTLLLVFLIAAAPWVVFRRFGPLAAGGLAIGLSSIYVFYEFFMVGNADHHGIAAASALMSALLLAVGGAGWVSSRPVAAGESSGESAESNPSAQLASASKGKSTSKQSRRDDKRSDKNAQHRLEKRGAGIEHAVESSAAQRFFIGSAAAGAVSLWVSAATAVPTFIGIGLGAILSAWLFGRHRAHDCTKYHSELWRLWGRAGSIGSIFFYLLEYFPSHMGMRLEVNHPLYALAWLGGGEILARMTEWLVSGTKPWQGKWALPSFVGAIFVVLLLPTLVIFYPERFFRVADSFLWNFHKDYIHEFKTFPNWLVGKVSLQTFINFCAFPVLLITILRLLILSELGRSWKGTLTLIALPALWLTVLGFMQVRWLGIANSLWISTIPICLGCIFKASLAHRFNVVEKVIGLCVAGLIFVAFPQSTIRMAIAGIGRPPDMSAEEAFGIYIRDLSYALRRANKDRDMVVVSGPTTTTYMMYYGGMRGIGTLYWENVPGLKATAEIYAAPSEDRALELCKKHQVTHIAIFKSDAFAFQYTRLLRGLPLGAEPKDAFIPSMITTLSSPRWLKPIHFNPPVQLGNEWLVLLEVKPEQTEAQAHYSLSEFLETRGERAGAINEVKAAIQLDPNYSEAWIRLGALLMMYEGSEKGAEPLEKGLALAAPEVAARQCELLAERFFLASKHSEAISLYRRSLQAIPDQPIIVNAIAWLLATSFDLNARNPEEALRLAQANVNHPNKVVYLDTLAATQAANGLMDEAVVTMKQAIEASAGKSEPGSPDPKVLAEHLRHFEAGLTLQTGGAR